MIKLLIIIFLGVVLSGIINGILCSFFSYFLLPIFGSYIQICPTYINSLFGISSLGFCIALVYFIFRIFNYI